MEVLRRRVPAWPKKGVRSGPFWGLFQIYDSRLLWFQLGQDLLWEGEGFGHAQGRPLQVQLRRRPHSSLRRPLLIPPFHLLDMKADGQVREEAPLGPLSAWDRVNVRPRSTSAEGSPHAPPVPGGQICLGRPRMKALPLVLCLALWAPAEADRSPVQQKALDLVLEDFHGRSFVRSVFKEQAVTEVAKEESSTGTFVHLEVELAQTHCRKHQRRTQNCSVKPGGRRQICLACFSFESRNLDTVLDKTMHCLSQQSTIFQETKRRHAEDCENVKKANGAYLPGQFAFSRGLP